MICLVLGVVMPQAAVATLNIITLQNSFTEVIRPSQLDMEVGS